MPTVDDEDLDTVDKEDLDAVHDEDLGATPEAPAPPESKLDAFGWKLVRGWGMLFRAIFISLVGFLGYAWLEPQSLGDVPFAELTLNMLVRNLFGFLIPVGCIYWFFNFPDQSLADTPRANPYVHWGQFGGWVVAAVLALYWLMSRS